MGYYENPPIINFNEGYNKVTAGIVDATRSISEALIKSGERQRLTIEKLQQQKNETDLEYNAKLSQWDSKNPVADPELNTKLHGMLQKKIQMAADAKIALLSETDNAKRSEYLKIIRNADSFMNNASGFAKNVAMDTATWRENASANSVGKPGGWVINGKNADEIEARTGAVQILGGMNQLYDDHKIDIEESEDGSSFVVKVKGRRKGAEKGFELPIDARSYLNSDSGGTGGFLQKVENVDDFNKLATKTLVNDKGYLQEAYLSEKPETVRVSDKYNLTYAQKINTPAIMAEIGKQAQIKASGYLRADKEASLRSLLDYTLEQQPGYYDEKFKGLPPNEQQKVLSDLLANNAFKTISTDWTKTTEKDGSTSYWGGGQAKLDMIEPTESKNGRNTSSSGSSSNEVQIFSQPEIDKYMQAYKHAFDSNKRDKPFIISWTGGGGGHHEESFHYDSDTGKIVRDTKGVSLLYFDNSKQFRDYLKSKKTVKKTPLKA